MEQQAFFLTKSNTVFVVCAICTCEAISCENLTACKMPSLALMRICEDVLVVIFEQFLINNILFCQRWLPLGCAIFSILVQDPVPAAEWAVEEQRLHCVSPTVPWGALLQLFGLTHGGPSLQIDREPPEPYFCRIRQVLWSQTRSNRHCCSQGSELACVATNFFLQGHRLDCKLPLWAGPKLRHAMTCGLCHLHLPWSICENGL